MFKKIVQYLNPLTWAKTEGKNKNHRMMNTINKITLLAFLIILVYLYIKVWSK